MIRRLAIAALYGAALLGLGLQVGHAQQQNTTRAFVGSKAISGAPATQTVPSVTMLRAVTPDNSNDLALKPTQSLFIGGAGTIAVIADGDTSAVTLTVVAGQELRIRVKRVLSTGTTATAIVAAY